MRHARVTENRLRVHALPIEARKKSRRSCAVETTIVEADTDLCGVGQKILASGKTRGNIPLAKPFKMDVLSSIVKGKGVSNRSAPPQNLQLLLRIAILNGTTYAEVAELADAQDL